MNRTPSRRAALTTVTTGAFDKPAEPQIRDLLSGHLCRCTGYAPIVRAALEAAAELAPKLLEDSRQHV